MTNSGINVLTIVVADSLLLTPVTHYFIANSTINKMVKLFKDDIGDI